MLGFLKKTGVGFCVLGVVKSSTEVEFPNAYRVRVEVVLQLETNRDRLVVLYKQAPFQTI